MRLIANVWNYDPEWKVEYLLDDKPIGALPKEIDYDPLAVILYKGQLLPAGRDFVEPVQSNHLFITHFHPSVKKVKVEIIDRFGNKYSSEADAK
jgi:hypothetical protein